MFSSGDLDVAGIDLSPRRSGYTPHWCKNEIAYRADVVQMMEEGIAKKEMARRTGLSVPTVRK